MAVGRLIGVVVSGSANGVSIAYLGLEVLDATLLLLALYALRHRHHPEAMRQNDGRATKPC